MAYDHEEQEQLATIKAAWKQYGNLITWVLILALGGYAAWMQWSKYQGDQSGQASQLYESLQQAVSGKDDTKVQRAANDLKEKFSATSYASMAALTAAKSAFEAGDLKVAKQQLQWVVSSSKADDYKALAKLRLAAIALDEKAYDEGLKQLSGEFPLQLQADVADRQGDLYVGLGKIDEARKAYQAAHDKMTEKSPARSLVQVKLDAIGAAAVAVK
ncbi:MULTISPECIES: tetratricopeptide repeat protein [unclassified Undibacterium]|uniref:YfgM family protein n=1 Tax=unclassified Undibacterium TaxID=2630295 RepID=UPI002AC93A8D|nr:MULTISPECIES: tetratricopeptide repeat protein [unclassified Undibacterium]MEB0138363.1 tetratricopeptide repeat protein [Undibacterium sp. CCC2.1]MEB0172740.1 tetratricopeptide repeat protein [Undibacterium sp. CCC1.1]MEB0174738.1 tetratricopeptide repeat protein [Undibacterium sp. CCC3.4]MEB0213935.1 tetratricopeptide repeat protein [Undibacterium sp. 5I2]WPX42659.1 tetratricopeptide repeat protein [Undibacterium sp. CCC3.4]